ncbi:MAG: response regulator, partial [Gemmataceae bacterium]|nr:response regulator [Gemmataceae bacterium]
MCSCNPAGPADDPTPPPAGYVAGRSISGVFVPPARAAGPIPVLVADDDAVSLRVLEATLGGWGYEVTVARDGLAAWEVLQRPDRPRLAVVDWMMPGLEGPEVCRRARALGRAVPTYLILLTAKDQTDDIVAGLDSGADDYVTKPFDRQELRS